MGLSKKMEWFRWIRKYSTGILDTKTGSMETLIDSASSKSVNYAYTSSISADDEFVNVAAPPHHQQQRPMLPPPPPSPQDHHPSSTPQLPPYSNDVYDCCVSLDGIPIKHEFQYTLSDTDGCGKITKHDIEGLASKILESMYGTTMKFSPRGQRTVKVTLNVRQSQSPDNRDRKTKSSSSSSSDKQLYGGSRKMTSAAAEFDEHVAYAAPIMEPSGYPMYGAVKGSSQHHHRVKPGAQRYRRDQLVEMVQKSLAENLSFQNQRKSNKPEIYHRPRTKRRQSSASTIQGVPLPSPPTSTTKPKTPAKVAWSPYDFEPVAYVPSAHSPHHHHQHQQHRHERHRNIVRDHQQPLYDNGGRGRAPRPSTVEDVVKMLNARQQHRTTATNNATAAIVGDNQQSKDVDTTPANVDQTKNITDHLRYKRAKLASKKIHHHIHEHHHYHHYDYYIV